MRLYKRLILATVISVSLAACAVLEEAATDIVNDLAATPETQQTSTPVLDQVQKSDGNEETGARLSRAGGDGQAGSKALIEKPSGQRFGDQVLSLVTNLRSPIYGEVNVALSGRIEDQRFDEAGVLNIFFDDLPGLNPRIKKHSAIAESPPHPVDKAILEVCTTDVRPAPEGACNGDWRLLASDFSRSRDATVIDTFTYVGFSNQVLLVDYADDVRKIRGSYGVPREYHTALGVPTTGRQEILLRGRRFGISDHRAEERYHSTFDGVRWDSFRIEGVDLVLVDGQPVAQWERVEGNGVRFVVPVHEAGTVEVTVCAGDQCISRAKGLKYVASILPGG